MGLFKVKELIGKVLDGFVIEVIEVIEVRAVLELLAWVGRRWDFMVWFRAWMRIIFLSIS